jgi:hypothetical protein
MTYSDIVQRARAAFHAEMESQPPLTLRGGNDVDSYEYAQPFDPAQDEPTDSYLEAFAFWGVGYLDAQSWRHYLPRLIDYALGRRDDPAMVTEALIRSLRPPDRYPPRLGSLTAEQEAVIKDFLELLALTDVAPYVQADAQLALEEWWLPSPRSRPTAASLAALRAEPATYRSVQGTRYRLDVPTTLAGSGERDIPQESRRVQTWGGYLCGDAHSIVAVNVTPLAARPLAEAVRVRAKLFLGECLVTTADVPGSRHAQRLDGRMPGDSPAEPQQLAMILAEAGPDLVTLSIRSWPRADVRREVERIIDSLHVISG